MTAGHDDDHVDPTQEAAHEGEAADDTSAAPPAEDEPTSVGGDVDAEQAPAAEEPVEVDELAERTADLQRLQAEYVNYRRRVERDRALARGQGRADVLRSLLTVLDDIGRAEQHGELEGGFRAVADQLRQALSGHGLEVFGAEGDAFDPRLHEALFAVGESADVQVTSVGTVVRTGYRIGDEVVRHAQVGVVEPAAAAD